MSFNYFKNTGTMHPLLSCCPVQNHAENRPCIRMSYQIYRMLHQNDAELRGRINDVLALTGQL